MTYLCPHTFGKSKGGTNPHAGYALEHKIGSKYYGMWVHADPKCRKPHHAHEGGIQTVPLSVVDTYKQGMVQ